MSEEESETEIGKLAPLSRSPTPASVVIEVRADDGMVPLRARQNRPTAIERLAELFERHMDPSVHPLSRVAFDTWAAAAAPATIEALSSDLDCYARFCVDRCVRLIEAGPEDCVRYVAELESRGLKPATVSRRLASIATLFNLFDIGPPTEAVMVRNAVRGLRRRQGVAQRQAMALRFGEALDREAAKTITLEALLQACGGDLQGLRDAAMVSLAYDAGLRVSELISSERSHVEPQSDGSAILFIPRSKTDQLGEGAYAWASPDTMRRVSLWLQASGIEQGPLFRRIVVDRRRATEGRGALQLADLSGSARVDRARMQAIPARPAGVTYTIGSQPLTRQGINAIYRRLARSAADQGLVDLTGVTLDRAIRGLSSHSMRVGLTQDLFAAGEDGSAVALALRWRSPATALRYARKINVRSNAAARVLAAIRA